MKLLRTEAECRSWRDSLPEKSKLCFVPTMGALHAGHAALLRRARARGDATALSIFVNPLQFGPNEDFARYPKAFEKDLEIARAERVDAVFAPSVETLYPTGFSTTVEESALSLPFCGPFRPGHFRGVCTVVLKLFHLIEPQESLFGLKDAQQFLVLRKMARDLSLPTEVLGVPTVREADGLAMSSRNAYLSPVERSKAPLLNGSLLRLKMAWEKTKSAEEMGRSLKREREVLEDAGFQIEYLEGRTFPMLGAPLQARDPVIFAVAARLGSTRLIDNEITELADPHAYGILEASPSSSVQG